MTDPQIQAIEIWGNLACFTQPSLKVERVTYPIITPSAARGILDAIFLCPGEFRWQIRRIEILSPLSYIALRRNEVKHVCSVNEVLRAMRFDSTKGCQILPKVFGKRSRTQRQTIALRDVHYRISAKILPWLQYKSKQQLYEKRFRSRLGRGQCIYQPYLGCREFPAYFSPASPTATPVNFTGDLGFMLYDVFDLLSPQSKAAPAISIFRAIINDGILDVPPYSSNDVLKPELQ